MTEARYRRAWVLGLGASGVAAARLLAREGAQVLALDAAENEALRQRAAALEAEGVAVRLGAAALPDAAAEVCVVSPGIPAASDWVRGAADRGLEVISELELGYRRCRCPLLAVTGSNGKSTLVKLCGDILAAAGRRAALAGNYGRPLCDAAPESAGLDWIVVEVSSFQLETVAEFHPRVAVLLNLQPNHLDRHPDFETYARLKARLFARLGAGDTAAALDELAAPLRRMAGAEAARWVAFGLGPDADYRYAPGALRRRRDGALIAVRGTVFDNPILGQTAAAAAAAADACGAPPAAVERALRDFQPLPHRLQLVARWRGVAFVNNSKATTLAALAASLRLSDGPARLIAGGLLKEHDLASVREVLSKKARCVYLIGQATEAMARAWSDVVRCRRCGTLEEAVREAWAESEPGETVLLAPGCASFDQFRNFEERGERFVNIVRLLQQKEESKT